MMDRTERLRYLTRVRLHYGIRCKNCFFYEKDSTVFAPWCVVFRKGVDEDAYCTNFDWRDDGRVQDNNHNA